MTYLVIHQDKDGSGKVDFHPSWRTAVEHAARLIRQHEPNWTLAELSYHFHRGYVVDYNNGDKVTVRTLEQFERELA